MAMAHYVLNVTFNPYANAKSTPLPRRLSAHIEADEDTELLTRTRSRRRSRSAESGSFFFFTSTLRFSLGPSIAAAKRRWRDDARRRKQAKIDASNDEMSKAATLEHQAKTATTSFAAYKALNAEGAPIAWFPPRIKVFFANEQIDKAGARLESSTAFKEPELSGWMKYNWMIEIPQADYSALGRAIADLENAEPLLSVTKLTIRAQPDQAEFQAVDMVATNYIQKKQ